MLRRASAFAAVLAAALAVAACGSDEGSSGGYDDASVRAIVEDIAHDPAAMCVHLSAALAQELGGAEGCARLVPAGAGAAAGVEISSVEVTGERAVARYRAGDEEETLGFVREAGAWRLAPERGGSR